jgi:staphylococcal nuclease domain-containing protein 1
MEARRTPCRCCEFVAAASRGKKSHDDQVDFVAAGSRFKVYMPKENTKITFVLAGKFFQSAEIGRDGRTDVSPGIRAPRTARSANEKSEPFGAESHRFASRYMQRDVEIGQ